LQVIRRRVSRATAVIVAVMMAGALPAWADDGGTVPEADPQGCLDIVQVLSAEFADFGLDPDDVRALHEAGLGFGDIFKLQLMAAAGGLELEELIAQFSADDGDLELGFGQWRHSLTAEQQALLAELPANLGQIVAAAHRSDQAGGSKGSEHEAPGHDRGSGRGRGHHHGDSGGDDPAGGD
jgi:hypothetical protein